MTKFRLDIDYDYDFLLIGISCHEKPYRLCWAVNRALELEMTNTPPLSIALRRNDPPSEFPLFIQEDTDAETALFLVANRSAKGLLIPEQHQADYFFIAKGPYSDEDHERMMNALKEIPFVLLSYRVDPQTLKSKENLLF